MASKDIRVEHADELRAIIDDISKVIARFEARGLVPTFSVKAGVLGMVACYRQNATNGTGRRGRPRKKAVVDVNPDGLV